MMLGAENPHLELADGDKAIIVPVLEVDEAHRRAFFACLEVLAHTGVLQQEVECMPVVLDQARAGKVGSELLDDLLDLVVFKPRIDEFQLLP